MNVNYFPDVEITSHFVSDSAPLHGIRWNHVSFRSYRKAGEISRKFPLWSFFDTLPWLAVAGAGTAERLSTTGLPRALTRVSTPPTPRSKQDR